MARRVAASYLASRPEVNARALGCVGLSGGGLRAALLQATCEKIRAPLLVQYDEADPLFTLEGMQQASARIAKHYAAVGKPENYVGQFYPGGHKFDLPMQNAAFDWLESQLRVR